MKVTLSEPTELIVPPGAKLSLVVTGSGCIYVGDGELALVGSFAQAKKKITALGGLITVVPDPECVMTLDIPALRSLEHDGWINEPSLTDLSPKPFGMVSPEVQAVIDMMNKNAIIREQRMLKALQQRQ